MFSHSDELDIPMETDASGAQGGAGDGQMRCRDGSESKYMFLTSYLVWGSEGT